MNNGHLILVDINDVPIGTGEKLPVHMDGLLHRAFSVFIFNSQGQLLLQQRAMGKYHSEKLWTNTCCSHPLHNIPMEETIEGRLMEEMGLTCKTYFQFKFTYKNAFKDGLVEHEVDHVFFGISDDKPQPNKEEVMDWKYISLNELQTDIESQPSLYTSWLRISITEVIRNYEEFKLIHNGI
ncbi:MAG: isopentenyl-diphosphate Delta-isomerase [Ginsengibacter sp.]